MKLSNYLLVTDMDGTLLNSNREVSKENLEAINRFVELGGKFAVATGRSYDSAKKWLNALPINNPCIFYNGSMVYDIKNEEVIHKFSIEKEKIIPYINRILNDYKDIVVEIFSENGLKILSSKEYEDPYVIDERDDFEYCNIEDIMNIGWYKLLLCNAQGQVSKASDLFNEMGLGEYFNGAYSHEYYFECMPKNISKGTLLRQLTDSRTIIAVGDQANDIEMMKEADHGIAVGNAVNVVKESANYIGPTNDEHIIANVINGLILKVI